MTRRLVPSLLGLIAVCALHVSVQTQGPPAAPGAPAAAGALPAPAEPNPAKPLYRHVGEQYRVYEFPGTAESIPYRLFVPSRWNVNTKLPLLVTLRAGTSVDNSYRSNNDFVKEAERRGY